MPSHQERVRKFNCLEHDWHLYPGVRKKDNFYFVLDGYECWKCGSIISKTEYNELIKKDA